MALKDAGITWKDIEIVVSGSQNWGGRKGIYAGSYIDEVMGYTGVPTMNINNACATGGTCIAVAAAMVASGQADIVLAVAADKSAKGFFPFLPPYHEEPVPADDTMRWLMGLPNPVYWALECRKKMEKYGITDEHLAMVKVATSKHGAINPAARYKKEFTLEEVLASPMVCNPLRLFEICATSDGAGAVILCNAKKAKQFTSKPVHIVGSGLGSPLYGDPTTRIPVLGFQPKEGMPIISESWVAARSRVRGRRHGPGGHRLRRGPGQQLVALLPVPRDHGLLRGGHRAPRARARRDHDRRQAAGLPQRRLLQLRRGHHGAGLRAGLRDGPPAPRRVRRAAGARAPRSACPRCTAWPATTPPSSSRTRRREETTMPMQASTRPSSTRPPTARRGSR